MNEVRYAGFWIRFLASFFDTLFLALPLGVIVYFLSDGNWFDFSQYQQNMQYAMSGNASKALASQPELSLKWELLFEMSVFIATIIFWKKYKGATPGKKFVHIKVVDSKTLEDITSKQAITRSFGYIVSTFVLLIGFFYGRNKKDKRGLHDLLADTVVIYDKIN
ncbi:MAG: RDD family protein [Sulfurimonas sp.]|nr:RDD family protein [Sulfurimonas sp.]